MATINIDLRNAQLSAFGTRFAAGTLTVYDGAAPANADAALSGNNVLATHTLAGFAAPAAGSMSANAIASETITGTGTGSFARLVAGTEIAQLTLGTVGTDVIVDSTSYIAGNTSNVNSLTVSQPLS